MRIERRNTTAGQSPYAGIDFRLTTSEIRNPDGSVVFRLENVEVPEFWSQVASDVLAQKYFRKAGVAARLKKVEEETVPSWLWRSVPDTAALADLPESQRYVSELSSKQVFDRLAGCWTYWGWKGSYFSSEEDAQAFFDELRFMLAKQMVAPNSPQWFNTGLHWAYGIDGPGQGHFYVDPFTANGTAITRCYNSQGNGDTIWDPPCGFSIIHELQGQDLIDFGFEVDDRYISTTAFGGTGATACVLDPHNQCLAGGFFPPSNSQAIINTVSGLSLVDTAFWIIVF